MNILFVTHEKGLNGASQSMLNLIDQMTDEHTFFVVSKSTDGAVQDELRKRNIRIIMAPYYIWERPAPERAIDIQWLKFKITWMLFGETLNRYSACKIKRALHGTKIDIIHVNTGVINLGIQLKKTLGVPLIWHLREFGKEDFGIVPLVPEKKFYREINKADGVIAISDAIYNKFAANLDKAVIRRIYNGVGAENINFAKTYHINKSEKLVILMAGKISPAKGQQFGILAVRQLIDLGYDNLELWIAGRGTLEDIGINPQSVEFVRILGQVTNLPEIRKQVDLELVCSRCEAFGRVTVEAMMGGIPVIGSNSGGTLELIKNGFNGCLVEYGNIEQLTLEIKKFCDNRYMLKEYGENARKSAIEHFLINRCAAEINDFYKEFTESASKSGDGIGYE